MSILSKLIIAKPLTRKINTKIIKLNNFDWKIVWYYVGTQPYVTNNEDKLSVIYLTVSYICVAAIDMYLRCKNAMTKVKCLESVLACFKLEWTSPLSLICVISVWGSAGILSAYFDTSIVYE